ncbi:MAG: LysR family positive regulator for ilvC [Candidatus Azotimanducaceae bacterium]
MDVHLLNVYLGLCRHLHFGRTSDEFHMSASALSRLIQKLELQLGHRLLERDNRHVALTEAGIQFQKFALDTRGSWDQLLLDMAGADAEMTGRLSLFATVTASQSILPEVLKQFRENFPGIQIALETGDAVNAIKRLREGVDVVITSIDGPLSDKFESRTIKAIPMVAISADVKYQKINGAIDWSKVPLILPLAGQTRDSIETWFASRNIRPLIYSEVPGNEAILSLTALGCGVGFVPDLVLQNSPLGNSLSVMENGPELEAIDVGFCVQKKSLSSSKIIQAFWHSI